MSFEAVATRYPWPDARPYPEPFHYSYDGGGRDLVLDIIRRKPNAVVLEVGAFLGGSVLQWLAASPDVRVVAVDPWQGDWWIPHARQAGWTELERRFAEPNGPLRCFLTNLWEHRDRVVAVPGYSPVKLHELADLGLKPDVLYFDSDKSGSGMDEAARLFPEAIITGDDWAWSEMGRQYPIREPVRALARSTGRHIAVRRATWVLQTEPLSLRQQVDCAIAALKDLVRPMRRMILG